MGMSVAELFQPVLAGGIHNTHFFNGRVLTADDLRTMQQAGTLHDRQLGNAIGDGVAYGLEVRLLSATQGSTVARPIVRVTAGLALNRRGDTLTLPADQDVALVKDASAATATGEFAECAPPRGPVALTNLGLYVLTMLPASGVEGRAPMTGLGNGGVASTCGSRFDVEGVSFRFLRLGFSASGDPLALDTRVTALANLLETQLTQLASSTPTQAAVLAPTVAKNLSLLRNGVAHLCLGTERVRDFIRDPFGDAGAGSPQAQYGALDEMRISGALAACEVPLALVYWTVSGVRFVDMHAVRRPLAVPAPSRRWALAAGDRRLGEAWASVLQFQAHLDDLLAPGGAIASAQLKASELFYYLPPLGALPVGTSTTVAYLKFFESRVRRGPLYVEGSKLLELIWSALQFPSLDLRSAEMSWLYTIHENMRAADVGSTTPATRRLVLFVNGYVPNHGMAQYDLAHWNYASYA